MGRKLFWFFGVFFVCLALDQATKAAVYTQIVYGDEIVIIPHFFSLVHAQNPGAAMGFLRDFEYRHYLFIGFTIIAMGIIIDLWRRLPKDDRFVSFIMGMIMSGAVGNGIDRVHKRTVTDFLEFYAEFWPALSGFFIGQFRTDRWPAFNVADMALVVGVSLFFLHYLIVGDPENMTGDEKDGSDEQDAGGEKGSADESAEAQPS